MIHKARLYIILILVTLIHLSAYGQFNFRKYQVDDGLSHSTVWCSFQDHDGFLWFGTNRGLNRFDAQRFEYYKNRTKDSLTIGNNIIKTIFELNDSILLCGTNKGVYKFNKINNDFHLINKKTKYGVTISSEVKKIIKTQKGTFWIATLGQGLFIYDPTKDSLTQNSIHTIFIWDLFEDYNTGDIYLSSQHNGLVCFNSEGEFKTNYFPEDLYQHNLPIQINFIKRIHQNIIFNLGPGIIGTLNIETKSLSYNKVDKLFGSMKCAEIFSDNELIIGTDNGFFIYDLQSNSPKKMNNSIDEDFLNGQIVNDIKKDNEDGFWIATYLGGIYYLGKQSKVFNTYIPYNIGLASEKVINAFSEDDKHNLWIGTQAGLFFLDTQTNALSAIKDYRSLSLDIKTLLFDNPNLWIGTTGNGLKVLNTLTNEIIEYYHARDQTQTICNNDIQVLYKNSKEDIFIGTSWGLSIFNSSTKQFMNPSFISTMVSVKAICEDSYQNIWIATNTGIYKIKLNNYLEYTHLNEENSLSSINNSVICMQEDKNGTMWFGTDGNGLCYFDHQLQDFTLFETTGIKLSNKVIYSIEEDRNGFFWLSTNVGLIQINPTDKTFVKVFTKDDGLQSNQFITSSSLKTKNDLLYFGGINGFNSFSPHSFINNQYIPPIYIVDIKLNPINKKNKTARKLKTSFHTTKKTSLPYYNNNLTFTYAALSYENPTNNKYLYQLQGFDDDWIIGSGDATYSNLPTGKYTFKVKGANNDNIWNESEASITIIILPPWWKTSYAILLYILIIITIIFFIFRFATSRANKKLKKEVEEMQRVKEKEMHREKVNFFINLVHEIRTPLSLISLPLEKLQSTLKENDNANHLLSTVNNNVKYLFDIVNQLLDFQKIEEDKYKLEMHSENINHLLTNLYDQFKSFAETKQIHFSLILPDEDVFAVVDKSSIYKIMHNLLGNAMKFTKEQVEIKFSLKENQLIIDVSDDGNGVPLEKRERIFEAFYQVDNQSQVGTGIGLAFSKLLAKNHKGNLLLEDSLWGGALFRLILPYSKGDKNTSFISSVNTIETKLSEDKIGATILIVEDNLELIEIMKETLSSTFIVHTASNGVEALKVLKDQEDIDLVVSDVMMPAMDGFELTKAIKSDVNFSHIPIILLTAKVSSEARTEALEYGADVYISKPFSSKMLILQIKNLLKLKQSVQKTILTETSVDVEKLSISTKDKEFMNKLYEEIDFHLSEAEFTIDNLAQTMFMSRSSFYRKIKSITGMSPSEFLMKVRLNKAAEMLLQNDYIIKEVYEQIGFNSSSYFAKCFKEQFGMLPKDYQENKGQPPH